MPNTSLTMVNQKLAYCRATRAMAEGLPEATHAGQRLQLQALLDAGAFHLLCAYRHYVRELGENYVLPRVTEINSEDDLEKALAAQGKTPVEIRELQQLRRDPNSWLAQLQASYQACWQLPVGRPGGSEAFIQAVDLDAPAAPQPVTVDTLNTWYRAFNELVARQRESSTEW